VKVAAANSALPSLTIGTNTTAASKSLAIAWNDEEKTTKKADFSFGKNAPSFSIGSSDKKKKKNAATKFSLMRRTYLNLLKRKHAIYVQRVQWN